MDKNKYYAGFISRVEILKSLTSLYVSALQYLQRFRRMSFYSSINFYPESIKVNCRDKELTANLYSNRAAARII